MLSRQVDTPAHPFHSWVREITELNDLNWPIWNGYLMLLISSPTNWLSWGIVYHCDDRADDGEWDSVKISSLLYCCLPTHLLSIKSQHSEQELLHFTFYKCKKHLPAVTLRQTGLLFCSLRESKVPVTLKNNHLTLGIYLVKVVKKQRHLLWNPF